MPRAGPSPFIIPAKAHSAAIGQSDAGWTRMVTSRLGPCSHVVWWRRRLRGRRRAGSWARGRLRCRLGGLLRCQLGGRLRCQLGGRLRCQLRDRLSALSESARADRQQSSKRKYRKNRKTHGVLPELPTSLHFSILSICESRNRLLKRVCASAIVTKGIHPPKAPAPCHLVLGGSFSGACPGILPPCATHLLK
jgi:hypothetical protein